jgi:hypothetical protein
MPMQSLKLYKYCTALPVRAMKLGKGGTASNILNPSSSWDELSA